MKSVEVTPPDTTSNIGTKTSLNVGALYSSLEIALNLLQDNNLRIRDKIRQFIKEIEERRKTLQSPLEQDRKKRN